MSQELRFSRPISAAAGLGNLAPDCHRFINKQVLLTGEAAVLATANGRECLLSSLRLLVRICPNLTISLPVKSDLMMSECRALARKIAFGGEVNFPDESPDFTNYDAILSVGTRARPELPWTVINSNGWLARVSSGSTNLAMSSDFANPIAALAAACLGVSEVFKRLIRLKERRGRLFDGLTFSLHSYRTAEAGPGPEIPADIPLSLLLVGVGAIGNGMIHLLSLLPTSGNIWLVDEQTFQDENLGTCLLIGPSDVDTPKAVFAEQLLAGKLRARGFHESLTTFQQRLGIELPYPRIILTGLHDIDSRHEAQSLWPDLLVDGAIGDFPCQVSRHEWGNESACLKCLLPQPIGPSAESLASKFTGLTQARVQQATATVTEEDVQAAPSELKDWLHERIGRQICSVVEEGVAQQISQDEQQKGFAPSVPFVACMSACMVIAELVKFVSGMSSMPSVLETRFQFDALRGPAFGLLQPQERRSDCECACRRQNIDIWRQQRVRTEDLPFLAAGTA